MSRVLVVDDMSSMRMLIRAILKDMGILEIVEASNGADALKYLQTHNVDLLICDWNMPGITGLDVLTAVRQQLKQMSLPVLMVTAEGSVGQVQQAIQAGVTSYVVKPFQPVTLKAHIRHCLTSQAHAT